MTKKQLRASKRPARPQKRRRFRGWHWEGEPRVKPGESLFIGRCRSRQGLPIFVRFAARPMLSGIRGVPVPRCRHCGGQFESVKLA